MSTYEERLQAVEISFKQFKTDSIKSYQDLAMEFAIAKGLTEDVIRRLVTLRSQIDQRFDAVNMQIDQRFAEVKQDVAAVKQDLVTVKQDVASVKQDVIELGHKFDRLEQLLLDRLPPR